MLRTLSLLLASLSFACLASPGVWTEDTPESPEVVVTATRVDSNVVESPGFVTVVTAKDIADSSAMDFAQAVGSQSGLTVRDYGTLGASQSLSIRGSSSSQVLVLLDGIPLNSSRDEQVDLSTVPIGMIDRIEIVRGAESSQYGAGAVGGVVNIITRNAGAPHLNLSVTNGSYIPHDATAADLGTLVPASSIDLVDTQKVSMSAGATLGGLGLTAGGSFTRAANAYTWDSGGGTWLRRDHAGALSGDGFASATLPVASGEMAARGLFSASSVELPGPLGQPSPTATQQYLSATGSLSFKTARFFTDFLSLDAKASYRYESLGNQDPNPPFPPPVNSLHTTHQVNADVTQRLSLAGPVSFVYGGSGSLSLADSTDFGVRQRLNLGGFLSAPVTLFDILTITPSLRYDYYSDFPGFLSFQAGVVLLVSETSSVKASIGSAYRAPSFEDLYWSDPFTPGNPNLQPETSYSGEIGWTVRSRDLSLDAAAFTRYVLNGIVWAPTGDPILDPWTPKNLGEQLLPGAEIHVKARFLDRLSAEAGYTFTYSFLLNDGVSQFPLTADLRVPFVPLHDATAGLRYEDDFNSVGVDLEYVGQRFIDSANTLSKALAGYFVVNADYRLTISRTFDTSVKVRNLLNAAYQSQAGYPMPPLSIETGVSVKL